MPSQPRRRSAALPAGLLGLVAVSAALAACDAVLGIHDVSLDPGEGGAGGAGGMGVGGGGAGGAGGQGGEVPQGDFLFSIRPPDVGVPYDGVTFVEVEVTRLGGFDAAVDVTVQGAPPGLVSMPVTIPSGEATGQLLVGASGALVQGTMFQLELLATSGNISRLDSVPAVVTGKPGTLDPGFSGDGIAEWDLVGAASGALTDVREVAGPRILVAGHSESALDVRRFEVARVGETGVVDGVFNGNARPYTSFCGDCAGATHEAYGVARLLNGGVLVAGSAKPATAADLDAAVLRLKADGAPDDIAGDQGRELVDLGGGVGDQVLAAALTADERLILGGLRLNLPVVAKLAAGHDSLDAAFGGSGVVELSFPMDNGGALVNGVAVGADGRVIAAGWSMAATRDVTLARLEPDGALDTSFGGAGTGIAVVTLSGKQEPRAMTIQPDGRILVLAFSGPLGSQDVLVLRLDPSGALDPTFGDGGIVTLTAPGDDDPRGMALLPDGRIVVAGNTPNGPQLIRLLPDGAPDPTFGTMGVQTIYLGTDAKVGALGLTADGKLLVAGTKESAPVKGFVARVWN